MSTKGINWDPAKHPRHPAGSSQGGEFAKFSGVINNSAASLKAQADHDFKIQQEFKRRLIGLTSDPKMGFALLQKNSREYHAAYKDLSNKAADALINKGLASSYRSVAGIGMRAAKQQLARLSFNKVSKIALDKINSGQGLNKQDRQKLVNVKAKLRNLTGRRIP